MNFILKNYRIIPILFFVAICQIAQSQEKVQVITKTIKKELKPGSKTLIINGEKSNIYVNSWDKDYFQVEIKLTSKNTNQKQAETDLNVIKYEITENNTDYQLKNYFASEKYGNVKSNLSATYNIKVPKNSKLDITNIYGNVYLSDFSSNTKLKNSFGEIHISNISGTMEMNSYYSDTWASDINLALLCTTDKSDLEMTKVSGNIVIKSNYGSIQFSPGKTLKKLEIDAKRTTITIENESFNIYNYALSTSFSNIELPDKWKKDIKKVNGIVRFNQIYNANNPIIKIQTTYCQIAIKN
jgi:hypothetical protein